MSNKTTKRLLIIAVIVLMFVVFLAAGFNTQIQVSEYTYTSAQLPQEFDGYRILQISDYHNKDFGNNQEDLIAAVAEIAPDIIVLTGDIVDEDHPDITSAQQMTEGIAKIAPVYYVTGNHELDPASQVQYAQYQDVMQENGVVHLDDTTVVLTSGNAKIALSGQKYVAQYVANHLEPADSELFNILLYHGSDNFDLIAPLGYDLVFSGHLHGGIVRIPFLGGVFSGYGEFFPKYDAGMFQNGNATLISSRGIGDAALPRFFNRPELLVTTLYSE